MRADAAAGTRIAHHEVVESGIGDEVEALQQRSTLRDEVVDVLHQKCPVACRQAPEEARLEGAMVDLPAPPPADHNPRFHFVPACQCAQLGRREQACEAVAGAAHEQRPLLPVTREKAPRREPTEQWRRSIVAAHARIIAVAARLPFRGALPLATAAAAGFPTIEPRSFALFSEGQYRRPGFPYVPFSRDTPVRWAPAVDLATGGAVHVPAAMVWHPFFYIRNAGDLPVVPPGKAGGLRAAYGRDVAVLPADRVGEMIQAGGFEPPVQFLQTGLVHAWYDRVEHGHGS